MHKGRADRVAALYLAGNTPAEISREVGCSVEYVHKIRRKRDIPPQHPRVTGSVEVREEIARRYRDGQTVGEIAEAMAVPKTSVYRCLREARVQLRRTVTPTDALDEAAPAIIAKYLSGMSLEDVAKDYGCSGGGIRNVLIRNEIPIRSSARKFIKFNPEEQARIIALRDAGGRVADIAREFGRDPRVVTRFLEEVGRGGKAKLPRVVGSGGYLYVRDANKKLILEHRHVMGQALGRPLEQHETVHHINGDVTDNRFENLQLRQGNHGKGIVMQCRSCGSHDVQPSEIAS